MRRASSQRVKAAKIDARSLVVDGFEKLCEFARDGAAEALLGLQEFGERFAEFGVSGRFGSGLAGQGANADAAEGFLAQDVEDLDAGKALDEQVGGAVVVFLAGAHDADGGDAVGRL